MLHLYMFYDECGQLLIFFGYYLFSQNMYNSFSQTQQHCSLLQFKNNISISNGSLNIWI